jgi:hypothetical protein
MDLHATLKRCFSLAPLYVMRYLTCINVFYSMNVFVSIFGKSWLLVYAYYKNAAGVLWLTADLLCRLQYHKDLCYSLLQGNFNQQELQIH